MRWSNPVNVIRDLLHPDPNKTWKGDNFGCCNAIREILLSRNQRLLLVIRCRNAFSSSSRSPRFFKIEMKKKAFMFTVWMSSWIKIHFQSSHLSTKSAEQSSRENRQCTSISRKGRCLTPGYDILLLITSNLRCTILCFQDSNWRQSDTKFANHTQFAPCTFCAFRMLPMSNIYNNATLRHCGGSCKRGEETSRSTHWEQKTDAEPNSILNTPPNFICGTAWIKQLYKASFAVQDKQAVAKRVIALHCTALRLCCFAMKHQELK